jgi:hypothetical protein
MKFQKILICATLALGTVISENVNYAYTTDDLKYNFHCVEDNNKVCRFLEKELFEAANAISKIIDLETPVKFEAFVDDLSKYRINDTKEVRAVVLDKEFVPLSNKDTNIVSPYPNSKIITENVSNENENNFYLVLNNFKSEENYLDYLRKDFDSSMAMEIFEELKVLELLGYPYVGASVIIGEEMAVENYMPKRKDQEKMDATATYATENCKDLVKGELAHTLVHWEDTLISKESINKKVRRAVKKIKCYVKGTKKENNKKDDINKPNDINRIVAVGDTHGDYEHLISILQHAKLVDEENNWIGKNSILIQMGDLMNRGNDTLKIYDTMMNIREQAKTKGGIVHMLFGNHEILELQGNHYFTSLKDFESFGGVSGREEAFGPTGKYGQFLRQEMNMTMVIGDSIFAHAGVAPEYVTEGVDKLNEHAREILLDTPSVEELYQLLLKNVTHPIFTDPIFDKIGNGPVNMRDFANKPESQMCDQLEKTLELTNTKRMIVGHTVQTYGKIRTKCNNKLILIDIGISRCIAGGYYGYLEMLLDKKEIWARYLN